MAGNSSLQLIYLAGCLNFQSDGWCGVLFPAFPNRLFDVCQDTVQFVETVVFEYQLTFALRRMLYLHLRTQCFGELVLQVADIRVYSLRPGSVVFLRLQIADKGLSLPH